MVLTLTLAGVAGLLVTIVAMLRTSWRPLVDALLNAGQAAYEGPPAEVHVLRPAAPTAAVRPPSALRIAA